MSRFACSDSCVAETILCLQRQVAVAETLLAATSCQQKIKPSTVFGLNVGGALRRAGSLTCCESARGKLSPII